MSWGKRILLAMGMAALLQTCSPAGEQVAHSDASAAGITSLRKNATVSLGGEMRVDYSYRHAKTSVYSAASASRPGETDTGDLALRNANLRLQADVRPNVRALFKLDFSSEGLSRHDDILEEALLVMHAIGGSGLEVFAGKGRAPYGQDITLGMLQSYHHTANALDTSEGRIYAIDPPDAAPDPANPHKYPPTAPMRPGQIDRAVLAGIAYEWDDRWRMELAAFKPGCSDYEDRLTGARGDSASDIGVAGRLWWRPMEDLVVQVSGMMNRSRDMARVHQRRDIANGVKGTSDAYAVSAGLDWTRGAWRVFGEYQHGWNWNFTKGYATDTWQIGAAREIGDGWRVAGMVEGLHIRDGGDEPVRDDFYKFALNVRYTFSSGLFVLGEYGREWHRREQNGARSERRRGNFFGVRMGFSF